MQNLQKHAHGPIKRFSRGVKRLPGQMNKLEAKYASHLEELLRLGEILEYKFDALKLRLADKTFYTPDFFVLTKELELEIHEVKGFWEDDARVKIKVAASLYPFRFKAVQWKKEWVFEEF